MKMLVDEDFVPKDYEELVRVYGEFVPKLVQKYNRVLANFEDLLQHTWTQLVAVKLIEKYHASVGGQPKQLTGEQAAAYLQMTWNQFKVSIWRGCKGDVRDPVDSVSPIIKKAVFERDKGICSEHGPDHFDDEPFDTVAFAEGLAILKEEDPKDYAQRRRKMLESHGISLNERIFWVAEKVPGDGRGIDRYKTVCVFCLARKRMAENSKPTVRTTNDYTPKPVNGGWASKKALYDVIDIEKFKIAREQRSRCKKHGGIVFQMPVTRSRFKLYLARSVHNIYANWCRTRARKYKELYLAPTEEGQAWESFLEDTGSGNQEAKLILAEQVSGDVDRLVEKAAKKIKASGITREDIEAKLRDGWTVSEVLKEFNLPRTLLQVVTGRYG